MSSKILQRLENNSHTVEKGMELFLGKSDSDISVLFDSMRYSGLMGGKRIRPTLTLEFCRALGGDEKSALRYGCALEMIHTYSLIHDDLPCMDNDDFRRGKPSNHKKFGEATALLAGDALLTLAFETACGNDGKPECDIAAVKVLAECAGAFGMIGGQQLDLDFEKGAPEFELFLKMNALKCGELIRAACLLGCIAAGKKDDAHVMKAAEKYAYGVGVAFQIEDDLLDIGEENKTTFLSYMSETEARAYAEKITADAKAAVVSFDGEGVLCGIADYLVYRKN